MCRNIAQPPVDFDQRIKKRGIVSALAIHDSSSRSLSLFQTYDFEVHGPSQRAEFDGLSRSDPTSLFPGIVPMATPQPATCSACTSCSQILKIPANTDLTHARVLVEDTGVALNVPTPAGKGVEEWIALVYLSPAHSGLLSVAVSTTQYIRLLYCIACNTLVY